MQISLIRESWSTKVESDKKASISSQFFCCCFSTTDFSISGHYCNGKLVSVAFNQDESTCCDDDSCCTNESSLLKLDSDFLSNAFQPSKKISDVVITMSGPFTSGLAQADFSAYKSTFKMHLASPPLMLSTALLSARPYGCDIVSCSKFCRGILRIIILATQSPAIHQY